MLLQECFVTVELLKHQKQLQEVLYLKEPQEKLNN
nr:MAG TPA: hypothetical protein [Caudoviricetes sp.]